MFFSRRIYIFNKQFAGFLVEKELLAVETAESQKAGHSEIVKMLEFWQRVLPIGEQVPQQAVGHPMA